MRLLLGLILILVLTGAGVATGIMLRPASGSKVSEQPATPEPLPEDQSVSFAREFIVPLVRDGRVRAHVVLSLGLESSTIPRENLLTHEAVMRDRLLEALFRHAAAGGFDGRFTDALQMNRLRLRLNETASTLLHPNDVRVLVTSIDRRDR